MIKNIWTDGPWRYLLCQYCSANHSDWNVIWFVSNYTNILQVIIIFISLLCMKMWVASPFVIFQSWPQPFYFTVSVCGCLWVLTSPTVCVSVAVTYKFSTWEVCGSCHMLFLLVSSTSRFILTRRSGTFQQLLQWPLAAVGVKLTELCSPHLGSLALSIYLSFSASLYEYTYLNYKVSRKQI